MVLAGWYSPFGEYHPAHPAVVMEFLKERWWMTLS